MFSLKITNLLSVQGEQQKQIHCHDDDGDNGAFYLLLFVVNFIATTRCWFYLAEYYYFINQSTAGTERMFAGDCATVLSVLLRSIKLPERAVGTSGGGGGGPKRCEQWW